MPLGCGSSHPGIVLNIDGQSVFFFKIHFPLLTAHHHLKSPEGSFEPFLHKLIGDLKGFNPVHFFSLTEKSSD